MIRPNHPRRHWVEVKYFGVIPDKKLTYQKHGKNDIPENSKDLGTDEARNRNSVGSGSKTDPLDLLNDHSTNCDLCICDLVENVGERRG